MTTVTLSLPDSVFAAVRWSPDELLREMRIEAASQWYARSRISQERAAELAGLTRAEFIDALAQRHIPVVQTDYDSLMSEVNRE